MPPPARPIDAAEMMEDFQSETDSDYTSYWRDWVRWLCCCFLRVAMLCFLMATEERRDVWDDAPETCEHGPLLSAFVRLSNILVEPISPSVAHTLG
jgi:protein-S-isoprenylcysteine O-methyltransferase Ste14